MNNVLLDEAQALFDYTRQFRRNFHMHPEIGLKEVRSAGIIAEELAKLGLPVKSGIGQTGVMALIDGREPGPVVLLRFDMDALPVQEQTGAEYASVNHGLMHACGHDAHMAIGLTVARILNDHRSEFKGTVKLMFQPGEEGLGGAELMIADGILKDPVPDIALAAHVWNEKPVGWVGIVPGPVMAAADTFSVQITGKGGHGASPNLTHDPILAASQVVSALQGIIARNVPPLQTAVVTVAAIHSGDAFNVIPAEAQLKGTIRTFEPEVRDLVIRRFHEIIENTAHAMQCEAQVEVKQITPAVINDPEITAKVQQVAARLLPNNDLDFRTVTMGSEDMAFVFQKVPGCYIFIGSANAAEHLDAPHHSAKFDIDESILPIAVGLMAVSAMELLKK
jgi:amidohydrolase